MAVLGALFVGTPASRVQAGKIFRQLNKVVLATVNFLSNVLAKYSSGRSLWLENVKKIW